MRICTVTDCVGYHVARGLCSQHYRQWRQDRTRKKARAVEVYVRSDGYLYVTVDGRRILQHRAVWESHHGPIPTRMHVHHRDGNPTNNDIANLELLTPEEHGRLHAHGRRSV